MTFAKWAYLNQSPMISFLVIDMPDVFKLYVVMVLDPLFKLLTDLVSLFYVPSLSVNVAY